MFTKLKRWWQEDGMIVGTMRLMGEFFILILAFGAFLYATAWLMLSSTQVDIGHGAVMEVPAGVVWDDQNDEGNGYVVKSGDNVKVTNHGDTHLVLTVSYLRYNGSILDTHAFEDLPPGKSKTFGADPVKYRQMHLCVTEGTWEE